jgi:enoyl-CoA hydratase/carnithine racemase
VKAVMEREGAALNELRAHPHHREAVNAFMEKRPPDFSH